eukprot:15140025-Heterocapsa_arctica.AAC.1
MASASHDGLQKVEISRPGKAIALPKPGRQKSNRNNVSCKIWSGPLGILLLWGLLSAAPAEGNPDQSRNRLAEKFNSLSGESMFACCPTARDYTSGRSSAQDLPGRNAQQFCR